MFTLIGLVILEFTNWGIYDKDPRVGILSAFGLFVAAALVAVFIILILKYLP